MKKLLQACIVSAVLSLSCGFAAAQDVWPSRTITMVVPFPAGGNADLIAREIAQALTEKLGKTVIVEQDFSPIVLVAKSPLIIVSKNGGQSSLKELIAFAKANPGKLNFGHPGNGTLGHITLVFLQKIAGVKIAEIPYRGTTPLMTDLLGGQIDGAIDFLTTYVPMVKADKVNPLAVTTTVRSSQLPTVPTAAEAGLAGFDASAWYAVVAPKGTPDIVVTTINKTVNEWLASDRGKKTLEINGMDGSGGTPADLNAFIAGELAKWGPLIKAANIEL
jgi:tripartite-type tricarboxylate transporter receptor subunit TctC